MHYLAIFFFFFFNDTATTEIYTLSLHDALPISRGQPRCCSLHWILQVCMAGACQVCCSALKLGGSKDRKSTRLNSSHDQISYAVFCLKKKKIANADDTLLLLTHYLIWLSNIFCR